MAVSNGKGVGAGGIGVMSGTVGTGVGISIVGIDVGTCAVVEIVGICIVGEETVVGTPMEGEGMMFVAMGVVAVGGACPTPARGKLADKAITSAAAPTSRSIIKIGLNLAVFMLHLLKRYN